MKLEYGKRYVTRDGRVTSPLVKDKAHIYSFRCALIDVNWMENGRFLGTQESSADLVREYEETGATIAEPAKPEQAMQTRVIKMAVMPKGEPIFSERATTIEIDDEAAGEFLVISQDHNLPDYLGKIVVDPEEWPAIKSAIETMIGYIEEAEKKDEA